MSAQNDEAAAFVAAAYFRLAAEHAAEILRAGYLPNKLYVNDACLVATRALTRAMVVSVLGDRLLSLPGVGAAVARKLLEPAFFFQPEEVPSTLRNLAEQAWALAYEARSKQ